MIEAYKITLMQPRLTLMPFCSSLHGRQKLKLDIKPAHVGEAEVGGQIVSALS